MAVLLVSAGAMGRLTGKGGASAYFLEGFAGYILLHFAGLLRLRRMYVFAHEFTHALAVWMTGGKVYRFVVRSDSGHVDLSHSGPFVALAPYWIPLYTLAVVAAYRLLLWAGEPLYAREVFLVLMGVSLAFHFAHTVESLWTAQQSDLGELGFALSMSLIALLNGSVILIALKCLFPGLVHLAEDLRRAGTVTAEFWWGAAGLIRLLAEAVA